jgi:hypothetical protein
VGLLGTIVTGDPPLAAEASSALEGGFENKKIKKIARLHAAMTTPLRQPVNAGSIPARIIQYFGSNPTLSARAIEIISKFAAFR